MQLYYTIKIGKENISLDNVIHFMNECDENFTPPLSKIVQIDIYAKKIFENADFFTIQFENRIVALIACYLNDSKEKKGFITYVSVSNNHKKKGLANTLLNETIKYAKTKKYKEISLEVNSLNINTIRLYEKFGFKTVKLLDNNCQKMKLIL